MKRKQSEIEQILERTSGNICISTENITGCDIVSIFADELYEPNDRLATITNFIDASCNPNRYIKQYAIYKLTEEVLMKYSRKLGILTDKLKNNIDEIMEFIKPYAFSLTNISKSEIPPSLNKKVGYKQMKKIMVIYNTILIEHKEHKKPYWTTFGENIITSEQTFKVCISFYTLKAAIKEYIK